MNAWQMANSNRDLPQTLRWGRDKTEPYHCDAIFVPVAWSTAMVDFWNSSLNLACQ